MIHHHLFSRKIIGVTSLLTPHDKIVKERLANKRKNNRNIVQSFVKAKKIDRLVFWMISQLPDGASNKHLVKWNILSSRKIRSSLHRLEQRKHITRSLEFTTTNGEHYRWRVIF